MKANFSKALGWVLDDEGRGYSEPPEIDQPTHSGITIIAVKEHAPGLLGLPDNAEVIRRLTDTEIEAIYRGIWDKVAGDELPKMLDYLMFGMAVNPGPSWVVHTLQNIVGAKEDGLIGPKTIVHVDAYRMLEGLKHPRPVRLAVGTATLMAELNARRCLYYASSRAKYQLGLMRRASKAFTRALTGNSPAL